VFVTIGKSSRVRPATIYDVAEAAGVSHQTVSRLLRGLKGIRPDTRARVETAIAELQYGPNRAARSLKNGRTHRIGALTHDLRVARRRPSTVRAMAPTTLDIYSTSSASTPASRTRSSRRSRSSGSKNWRA
jgi:transcriptional regulator with XRE-family HTH domain